MTYATALPQALNGKTNKVLMQAKDAGDLTARQQLIEGNMKLVFYSAQRYQNTGIDVDDLVSVGSIGLIKAVDTFKLDKNIQFATYAATCINNEILMMLRKNKKHKDMSALEDVIAQDADGNGLTLLDIIPDASPHSSDIVAKQQEILQFREMYADLSKIEQKIISLRYLQEYTQRDVSEALGISQSYVSRLEKKSILRMREVSRMKDEKFAKETIIQKPKGDVIVMANEARGNREEAIKLLKETVLTYKEIAEKTGVPHGTVGILGGKHRPKHVREENLYRINAKEEQKQIEEQSTKFVQEPAPPIATTKQVSYAQNLGDALGEFRAEIEKEIRAKLEEEMAAPSEAKQASEEPKKNGINRKLSFKYEANAMNIQKDTFVEELQQLLATFQNNEHQKISFSIEITAD